MKIILKENFENLGAIGDAVNVARGYAVNYLIPRKLAIIADNKSLKQLEHEKRIIAEKAAKAMSDLKATAQKLSELKLVFERHAGEEDKLFGSVTHKDVADALVEYGYEIDKKKILIDEPIRRLGAFKAAVKLHADIIADIAIEVIKKEAE
jgi:large subunit ribosomal protein L9